MLATMKGSGAAVDNSAVMKAIDANRLEVVKTIREKTLEVDFSRVLKAIDDCRNALDLSLIIKNMSKDVNELRHGVHRIDPSPVMKEVQLMKTQVDDRLSAILVAMKDGSVAVDNAAVVKAIEAIRIEAIRETPLEVDFSSVLKAIDDSRNALDLSLIVKDMRKDVNELRQDMLKLDPSPVKAEVQLIKSQVDARLSAILTTIDGSVVVDNSAVMKAIEAIRTEVNALQVLHAAALEHRPEVDFSPVLQAIYDCRTALDYSQSMEEVKRDLRDVRLGKVGVDLPVVMKDVQKTQSDADVKLSTVLQCLTKGTIAVDTSRVIEAINSVKGRVDLSQVLEVIRQHKPEVDLKPVLEAINDSRAALLVTMKEGNLAVDVSGVTTAIGAANKEVLRAIADSRTAPDLSEVTRSVEAAQAEVCKAIREQKPDVDLSPVITAINSSRADPDPLLQNSNQTRERLPIGLTPLMREVQQVQSQLDAGLSEVLKLMNEGRLAVDLSPVMKALGERVAVPDVLHNLEEIRQTVNEFREGKLKVDLSLVATQIKQIQSHIDSGISAVRKDMHEDKMASECFAEMTSKAISVSKDEVIDVVKNHKVDVRPVLQAVRDASAPPDLTQNLEEIRLVLNDLRRGPLGTELPQVLEDVRQLLLQAEHNRSGVFRSRSLDDARADGLRDEPCAELEGPEEVEKTEAQRRCTPWHGALAEPLGQALASGGKQQDLRRRPASAPPRSSPWRWEAEQSREDPTEDPEVAFAESFAVRAQHLADAAAEAQCRAEAIEATEAVMELPMETSVQSLDTEGWLPPIPEEPDPEAAMPTPAQEAQHMVQSAYWKILDGLG